MAGKNLDVTGVEFDVLNPIEAQYLGFLQGCHEVKRAAFNDALAHAGRTPEQIGHFVGSLHDFERFHRMPQSMAEEGLVNPDQTINRPYVALAVVPNAAKRHEKRIVGYAYSADNASGATEQERAKKQRMVVKNWRWLEMVAVDPEFQSRGIAKVLIYLSMRQAHWGQPVSAYTWPNESPLGARLLSDCGITDDGGRQTVYPYGSDGPAVEQHRHSSRLARMVARRIARQGGDADLFKKLSHKFGGFGKFISYIDRTTDDDVIKNPTGY